MNNQTIKLVLLKTHKFEESNNISKAETFIRTLPELVKFPTNLWDKSDLSITIELKGNTTEEIQKYIADILYPFGLEKVINLPDDLIRVETGIKLIRTEDTNELYLDSKGIVEHLKKIHSITQCQHVEKFIKDIISMEEEENGEEEK